LKAAATSTKEKDKEPKEQKEPAKK
jgi:hypothetical protein